MHSHCTNMVHTRYIIIIMKRYVYDHTFYFLQKDKRAKQKIENMAWGGESMGCPAECLGESNGWLMIAQTYSVKITRPLYHPRPRILYSHVVWLTLLYCCVLVLTGLELSWSNRWAKRAWVTFYGVWQRLLIPWFKIQDCFICPYHLNKDIY